MAGIQVASLFASIGVDAKPLEKGLGGAKQSLQQFGGEMAKQIVGTVSLTAAIYKAGQAVVESIVNWADYADTMRLSAQMAGVTTEEMSRLSQVADDFRVPMETMQRSMEMALKNGFTPTIENIAALSDELLGITDPAARAAAASKIFGKSYADMMPFLLAGGDAIRSATENVSDNLVVTEQAAADAKAYKDALDELGDSWTGMRNTIASNLLPVITNVFNQINASNSISELREQLGEAGRAAQEAGLITEEQYNAVMLEAYDRTKTTAESVSFLQYYLGLLATMSGTAGASVSALSATVNSVDLSGARKEYLMTAATLREDLAGAYADVADAEDNWRSGVGGSIKTQLDTQFDGGVIGAEEYLTKLQLIDDQFGTDYVLKYKMELEVDDLFKTLMENPEEFANKASAFEDYFMPLDESVGAAMERVAELQAELNKLERVYTAFVNISIRKAEGGYSTDPAIDNGHLVVGETPQASGGLAFGGSPYIVGERGPELFVPNANGQIIPNNELGGGNSELLGDILLELQNQPSRIKVAIKEAMALVGG